MPKQVKLNYMPQKTYTQMNNVHVCPNYVHAWVAKEECTVLYKQTQPTQFMDTYSLHVTACTQLKIMTTVWLL